MANRFVGEGQVTTSGEVWKLRFDMNVLADLEDQTGKSAMSILAELDTGDTPILMRRLICHAMLMEHHPLATLQDAGRILSEDAAGFFSVLQSAMPKDEQADRGNGAAKAGKRR